MVSLRSQGAGATTWGSWEIDNALHQEGKIHLALQDANNAATAEISAASSRHFLSLRPQESNLGLRPLPVADTKLSCICRLRFQFQCDMFAEQLARHIR